MIKSNDDYRLQKVDTILIGLSHILMLGSEAPGLSEQEADALDGLHMILNYCGNTIREIRNKES